MENYKFIFPMEMEGCVNRRLDEETNQEEDPITFEPVIPEEVISIVRDGRRYCYNVFALLRLIDKQRVDGRKHTLPESRHELTLEEINGVYSMAESRFPTIYIVTYGNVATPYTFTTEVKAVDFVTRKGEGSVYGIAQTDDADLYDLIYPNGLDNIVPLFSIRQGFQAGVEEEAEPVEPEAPVPLDRELTNEEWHSIRDEVIGNPRGRELQEAHYRPFITRDEQFVLVGQNEAGAVECFDIYDEFRKVPCSLPILQLFEQDYELQQRAQRQINFEDDEADEEEPLNAPPPPLQQSRDENDNSQRQQDFENEEPLLLGPGLGNAPL
jgi:hypothetical protein